MGKLCCKRFIDEPGSHGFVKFRIQHKPGLADNTIINNDAQIYFDFNEPIFTNNAFITLTTNIPFSQSENIIENNDVLIYPQPADNIVYFKLKKELVANAEIIIYDVYGRQILENKIERSNTIFSVTTEKLNSGFFMYELKSLDGTILFTGKLTIQR
ncbi:MAG: T9SS type A sorting domain-containing protein [Bacteroidetes bacterium]|nr:T9SS type A sorting domain-containing protein [Bacteroidota bacterium]